MTSLYWIRAQYNTDDTGLDSNMCQFHLSPDMNGQNPISSFIKLDGNDMVPEVVDKQLM